MTIDSSWLNSFPKSFSLHSDRFSIVSSMANMNFESYVIKIRTEIPLYTSEDSLQCFSTMVALFASLTSMYTAFNFSTFSPTLNIL